MRVRGIVTGAAVVALAAAALTGCGDSSEDPESAGVTASPSVVASEPAVDAGKRTDGADPSRPDITPPPTPSAAADLPTGLTPVTADSLRGFWVPTELPKGARKGAAFVRVDRDGSWVGSDGCNGTIGGWAVGDGGSLATNGGASTLMACEGMVGVPGWFTAATAAGFDGSVLVLVGEDGGTQRLEKGVPASRPTGPEGQTS